MYVYLSSKSLGYAFYVFVHAYYTRICSSNVDYNPVLTDSGYWNRIGFYPLPILGPPTGTG